MQRQYSQVKATGSGKVVLALVMAGFASLWLWHDNLSGNRLVNQDTYHDSGADTGDDFYGMHTNREFIDNHDEYYAGEEHGSSKELYLPWAILEWNFETDHLGEVITDEKENAIVVVDKDSVYFRNHALYFANHKSFAHSGRLHFPKPQDHDEYIHGKSESHDDSHDHKEDAAEKHEEMIEKFEKKRGDKLLSRSLETVVEIDDKSEQSSIIAFDCSECNGFYEGVVWDHRGSKHFEISTNYHKEEDVYVGEAIQGGDGKLLHIILSVNLEEKRIDLYVDGLLVEHVKDVPVPELKSGTTALLLGKKHSGCDREKCLFNGSMKYVKMYDEALTAADSLNLYMASQHQNWDFDYDDVAVGHHKEGESDSKSSHHHHSDSKSEDEKDLKHELEEMQEKLKELKDKHR